MSLERLMEFLGEVFPFFILAAALWLVVWIAFAFGKNFRLLVDRLRRATLADGLWVLIVLVFLQLVLLDATPTSLPGLIAVAVTGEAPKTPILKARAEIDAAFSSFAHKGNVFLYLIGFNPDDSTDHDFLELYYYRACYAAYPRRVYCADPKVAINRAGDIAKAAFVPDDAWFERHQVVTVTIFRKGENGHVEQEAVTRATGKGSTKWPTK